MRQYGFGLGVGNAIRQAGERLKAVDGDVVAGGDLGAQAQLPQAVERAVPEGDDVRTHPSPSGLIAFSSEVGTGSREENASNKK